MPPPAPRADQNQAELTEEEDSSLFFVQLPTKLPRPLPAFQRAGTSTAKDGGGASSPAGTGKGKGKSKASGLCASSDSDLNIGRWSWLVRRGGSAVRLTHEG